MKRILVYISNADLKKKILSISSKLESYNFIFLSDIDDFIGEFKIIQPDILIVGDQEFKKLAINTACHVLINSISKLILARNDSKETLITSGLNPVILQPDFDITDFKQLTTPISEFNNQFSEEKQPKIELRDEKHYLQILMDNIPDTIYFKDLSSKFIRVNQAHANIMGLQSPDEVIGKTDFDFFPEEQARLYFQDELDIMKSGEPLINQIEKVNRADGSTIWVSTTKIPIKDDDGAIVGLVGVSRDVTKFKMKLQQEKSLLNGLLNNIPDLIYFKDLDSRFIRINKAHAKTIGVQNPKDAIGKKDADFFDETHSKDAYNAEQEMMRTGEPILNKLEHIKTTDGYRYVTTTKIPLKDDQGVIIGMVGVTRDVTKSHSLEMNLQQETNLLNALLDSVPDSVYFKDTKSKFIRVSKSWLKKHNIPDGEGIIGKSDADFMVAEFAKETYNEEQIMMETGKPLIDKLQTKIDVNGKKRYDIANKVPIFDHDNKVVGMFGISRDITELKNAELKLFKEKELLQSLMDNTLDTIYFKDTLSRFTKINLAQAKCLGAQSPEDAIGKTDFDYAPKEQASLSFQDEVDIMKTGKPLINRIEKVKRADGSITWVSTTKIPIKDQSGKISGMVGVSRDVTESHILEMKLQQETYLLNALLDNVPDSVYFKDKKSQFVRVSKSWLNKHNLAEAEEAIGKTDADFSSSEFAKETLDEEQLLMETGEPLINKIESIIDVSGKLHHKLVNKIPFSDVKNKVVGMVGISRDITEFKNAELKLNKEKELLQSLMDNIPDTIYFKDALSRFTRINKAQAVCLGIQSPDDAIGKTDFDYSPKEQASLSFQDELDIMKSGKPLINRVESVQRSDGSVIWVSTTKIPVKDQFGKISGTVGMSRDITVLEEARSSLVYAKEKSDEANRAKSLFLANMSHEIRTPMNGVIGMSDVLNQTTLTDEQREYLSIITKSGNSLLSIINNILDFSKIESGSLELEKAPINIRQVIENVADVLITTA
ncbi:MAG: PAS domain-containing protein, partial [Bacteroidia bacterium]|nr:PAS domain-containing protein [Bacteroidia bacterium]